MSHFKNRIELFKNPAFCYYVISCSLAMFGNGLTYVAMAWILVKDQHQIAAISVLMTCFWLPNIILGPLAGVIVDKHSRKYLMLSSNFLRALLLIIFWLLFVNDPPSLAIYSLAMLTGTILSLYIPSAMTFVREIVDKKDLLYANATADMAYELGAVAGMGASGLIIGFFSVRTTFLINGICYLLATLCLIPITLKKSKKTVKKHQPFFKDLTQGFFYILRKPPLQVIYMIQMLFFVSFMTAPILLAPYAKTILHTSAGQFGYIEAAMSVGAVIGGVLSPYFSERFGFFKLMFFEALLCGVSFYYFSHNLYIPIAILWYFFIGFCFSAWPLLITAAQEKTALSFQGRVQSLFNTVSGVMILLLYASLSFIGDHFQIYQLYWLEVMLMILSIILLLVYRSYHPHQKKK